MATFPRHQGATPEWSDTNCHAVLEASPDAMLVVNRAGEIVAANLQAEKLYGLTREQLIGMVVESLLPVRFRERHRQHRENFLANPEKQFMQVPEIVALRSDASEFPVDVSLSRLTIGSETFAISAIRDATERRRIEGLKASAERRGRLVQNSSVAMVVTHGLEHKVELLNDKFTALLGYTIDDIPDVAHWWPLAYPDEAYRQAVRSEWETRTEKTLRDGPPFAPMEVTVRCKDGSTRHLEVHLSSVAGDTNLVTFIDLTERKRAEEAMRESEERLRLAQQAARIGTFEWNIRTGVNTWTPELEAMYGLPPGSFGGTQKAFENLVHPDDLAGVIELVDGSLKTGQPTAGEWRAVWPDGSVHWVAGRWQLFMNESGEPSRMIGVNMDITERRHSEERLREYEQAVEGAEEMIAVVDRDYRYLIANRQFLKLRNKTHEQVVGHFVNEVLQEGVFEAEVKPRLDECFQGKVVRYEMKYTYPELGERDLLISYFPIEGATGIDRVACILQDITDRKRAEEAVKESEQRFRLVADTAPVMIWMSGLDKKPTYFSQLWLDFTGFSETDLQDRLEEIVHPEDYPRCHDIYCRGFDQRQPFRKECRLRRRDGQYRWMLDIGVPRFHKDGSFAGYIGSCVDVTQHKQAEEAISAMTRKLVEAQEQERARIARELHDDINQRLAMLAVELEQLHDPSESQNRVQRFREELRQISNDVQALSHDLHSTKLEYLGVVAGMKSCCKEFAERQKMDIDFKSDVRSVLPLDIGRPLFRVLQEALHNSFKHSAVKRIEVQLREDSGEIHLIVRDLGRGFEVEAALQGKGLGLTSMRERVRLVNGTIVIDSKPMGGTTINVRVPFPSEDNSQRAAV